MFRPTSLFVLSVSLRWMASSAQAQVRVPNCNDTGPGGLRAVAEAAPGGSFVELRGLPCSRIVLTSGPIRLSQDFIGFQGPGWSRLTVSGDGRSRVFVHTPPPPVPLEAQPTLSLQGFTVSWGRALDDEALGGCIFAGGRLSLRNMQVHHCLARDARSESTAGFGGGAFSALGTSVIFSRIHHPLDS